MKHYIITSSDGSNTLKLEEFDECYHSTNGAFAEACHIYIHSGLEELWNYHRVCVIDVGLGTALNCITTLLWHQALVRSGTPAPQIHYIGLEKYPISFDEALMLNFPEHITEKQSLLYPTLHNFSRTVPAKREQDSTQVCPTCGERDMFCREEVGRWFEMIHMVDWEKDIELAQGFTLTKQRCDITECLAGDFCSRLYPEAPSAIFYDTFSPATQPHLWDKRIFEEIFKGSQPGSILTTYSSKGIVKQALREAGFKLERLPGPAGKRHILRARKIDNSLNIKIN